MKSQDPKSIRASEPEPVETEMRQEGLKVLARVIARVYARDIELMPKTGGEPDNRHCDGTRVADQKFGEAEIEKVVHRGTEENGDEFCTSSG